MTPDALTDTLSGLRLALIETKRLRGGTLQLFVSGKLPTMPTLHAHFAGSGWRCVAAGWQHQDGAYTGYLVVRGE